MDRDGTGEGYDLELLQAVADAVLAASRFHFEDLTIRTVKRHLASLGIPVRW